MRKVSWMLLFCAAAACGKEDGDKSTKAGDKAGGTAPAAKPAAPPPEPGLEVGSVIFCSEGTHVREGLVLENGSPYGALVTGTCNLTLRKCKIGSGADGRPTIEVAGGKLRLEDCTVTSTAPKAPAIWVTEKGSLVLVNSELITTFETSLDVWKGSSAQVFGTKMSGGQHVEEGGTITALTAAPP